MKTNNELIEDIKDYLLENDRIVFAPSITIGDYKIASVEYKKNHIEALTSNGYEYLDEVFADNTDCIWSLWDCIKEAHNRC